MYEFLDTVSEEQLWRIVKRATRGIPLPEQRDVTRANIYRALFSLYGFEILHERHVRLSLLASAPRAKLDNVLNNLGLELPAKQLDAALSAASLRWSTGGPLAQALVREFGISAEFFAPPVDDVRSIELVSPIRPLPPAFDYQDELSLAIDQALTENKRCLMQLPTGAGKTRTAMEYVATKLARDKSDTVLWLAHTEELAEQAVQSFKRVWAARGNRTVRMGRWWGGFDQDVEQLGPGVLVAGFQKLAAQARNGGAIGQLQEVSLIVVDEAHRALAPVIAQVIDDIAQGTVSVLGLTATPGRGVGDDQDNRRLARMFGGVLVRSKILGENPVKTLQSRGILSRITRVVKHTNIPVAIPEGDADVSLTLDCFSTKFLHKLAVNPERNNLISDIVVSETRKQRSVLVFACTTGHARSLAVSLAMAGIAAGAIDHETRTDVRTHLLREFGEGRIRALFNYGVLTTGVDIPRVDVVIIARPTSSIVLYSQMLGRGLRGPSVGGTAECRLYDIRDNYMNFGAVDTVYQYFQDYWKPAAE